MPQTITITKTDPAVNHISVSADVTTVDGDEITFVNELDPSNDAVITFYRNARRKENDNPINNFCGNGAKTFAVGAGSTAVCDVRPAFNNREYLYTVEASPQYVTLDPVIILDRPGKYSFLEDITPGAFWGIVAAAAIAALVIGFQTGKSVGRKGSGDSS